MPEVIMRCGRPVRIRPPRHDDRTGLIDMHRRCGPRSRFNRWLGNVAEFPPTYLGSVLDGAPEHPALLAELCGDVPEIIGLASAGCVFDGPCDLAILVEDRFQRQGIGSALCDALVGVLPAHSPLVADGFFDNRAVLRLLARYGRLTMSYDCGVAHAVVLR